MRTIKWQPIFLILACCLSMPFDPSLAASSEWLNRVDAWVIETASGSETEFILFLNEQADLSQAMFLPDKKTKGTFVYETLHRTAESSQKPILQVLDALGVEYRPYWVANMIWVRGGMQAVQTIASRQDVAHLYANPTVRLDLPEQDTFPTQALQPQGIEWNLSLVNADDVWAAGFTGQGAVIGGADTGYQWEHPALKRQYRGWDGLAVDHNYNWHDAIHSNNPNTAPGNPCGFDVAQPCDDHGHGTHTMGIMVGDDGAGNQIGMAPGARWIGCRNMEQGWGSPITYAECYQWFIAPTDLNDQKPNPELAPDVINNSWSCPASEGCVNPDVLRQVVENVRAAGILTVHSAGNSGPSCSSISQPAAIYDASFSVGNTTAQNGLSSSSSRGPVLADGSGRLKPDITAPGTSIRSSYPGGYTRLSGTSMAAPHVAGMAALLISADPALGGQVDRLEQWITQTAFPLSIPLETCGGIPSTTIPNNSFGWGRINAWGPFVHRLHIRKSAFPDAVLPGETVTYTLTTANLDLIDIAHGILLTDTLPAGTAFLTASSPYTLAGRTVRWELAELPPGISWEVQLTVQATGPPGSLLINSDFGLTHQEGWFFTRGADIWTPVLFQYFIPFYIWEATP